MSGSVRLGLLGLDSSHAPAFARLLLPADGGPPVVSGGELTAACSGPTSGSFAPSRARMSAITAQMSEELGIPLVQSPTDLADKVDVVIITAADPRSHPELFAAIAPAGKPVLIDKILCADAASAAMMAKLATRYGIPLMCGSVHRYAAPFAAAVAAAQEADGAVSGVDLHGPVPHEPPVPPMFWYGSHLVDLLYAALDTGCRTVRTFDGGTTHDTVIVGSWQDGRIATLRCSPSPARPFSWEVRMHRPDRILVVDPLAGPEPRYAGLITQVVQLGRTKRSPVPLEQWVEVVRFAEAAERSRATGMEAKL